MNFKKVFFSGLAIVLICLPYSCDNSSKSKLDEDPLLSQKADHPKSGGELRLIENEIFTSLLPYSIEESVGYRVASQIHNSLLKFNPKNLTVEPSIAKSWEVNDEQTKYIFHLRNNVFFHNDECFSNRENSKLSPYDIVHTFELLCGELYNNEHNMILNNLLGAEDFHNKKKESIEGIKIIDDSTISFELNKPTPSIIYLFASTHTSITSKLAYDKYGTSIVNGCGPFKYSGLSKDSSSMQLTKNENYFLKDSEGNSLPYLDSITVLIKKENDILSEMFVNNKIMVLPEIRENEVEQLFETYHKEFDDKNYLVDRKVLMSTNCYEFNVSKAPFDNVKVRQAFCYAINKKSLIENIMKGQAKLGNRGIVPFIETFNNYNYDSLKGYDYNPEKAKKLLTEAGYPNGKNFPEVSLELSIGNSVHTKTAKEFQNQIQNVLNVSVTIDQESRKQKINRAATGKSNMFHFTWLSQYPSPIEFLNLFYSGNKLQKTDDYMWPNVARFKNKLYDQTIEKALVTSDVKNRYKLFSDAENILLHEAPMLVLWYPEEYNIIHGYVKNLHFNEMLHFDYTKVYINK